MPDLPNPESRVEQYLANLTDGTTEIPKEPESRIEQYLDYLAKNGGAGVNYGTAPAAAAGMALVAKTIVDGKVTEWEFGDAGGLKIHICTSSEYGQVSREPVISSPDEKTLYLVPAENGSSPDLFVEWAYVNNNWEMFGSASIGNIPDSVNEWLTEHITNPDNPPLDRSLTSSSAAAPADLVGEELTNLKQDLSETESVTRTLTGEVVIDESNFDIGTINFSSTDPYWTYTNNMQIVRTKEGFSFHLKAGTKIELLSDNPNNVKFKYCGVHTDGTVVYRSSWSKDSYTTTKEGDFVIILWYGPSQTSVKPFVSLLKITDPDTYDNLKETVEDTKEKADANESFVNTIDKYFDTNSFDKDYTIAYPNGGTTYGFTKSIIIPKGVSFKIAIKTDAHYRGDQIQVRTKKSGWVNLRQTFSGEDCYNKYVTVTGKYDDTYIYGVRIYVNNVSSESGNLYVSIEFEYSGEFTNINNLAVNNPGPNLVNPVLAFNGIVFVAATGLSLEGVSQSTFCVYVPIKSGETITFNRSIDKAIIVDTLYDAQSVSGSYDASATQQITNSGEADAFALICFRAVSITELIGRSGNYAMPYKKYNPVGAYTDDSDDTYGTVGLYYPEQLETIKMFENSRNSTSLRFVHLSDTHIADSNPIGWGCEFTDLSAADFMTITGDLVNDNINNSFTAISDQILAMEKPCYICMGNHDIWNATTVDQKYDKYFNPIAEHNDLSEDISYYAVDYSDKHVKCIYLDQYELSTGTPGQIMSETQVNWFLDQLDDAITNNLHVCLFYHDLRGNVDPDKKIDNFYDKPSNTGSDTAWIPNIIDAFQKGESVTFTHNSIEYTHTFNGNGVFVAHFCGHKHWDSVGWLKGYNQFAIIITRHKGDGYGYTINDKLGIAMNYVMVSPSTRRLSVLRLGCNKTIIGVKRTNFSVIY